MTFLNPGFLWALFAVAIPLIIHLLNFRPYKTVYFSNLRFLQRIDQQSHTRRKLKEYILLFLRMLAIASLVIAFAQPVKKKQNNNIPCSDKVVLYIDNSFSMSLTGRAGDNIEVAKKKAYEIVKAFPPDARFIILSNDFTPEQFRSYNSQQVRDIIAQISISSHTRKLSQVVSKLEGILSEDTTCKNYVFILSDFQKITADLERITYPLNWQIVFIPLNPVEPKNIGVDSVFFSKPYHLLGSKDSLVALVHNYSESSVKNLRVELWINDTLKGFENISVLPGQLSSATFSFVNSSAGWNVGQIKIKDLPVDFDNSLFFSFFVKTRFNILLLSSEKNKFLSALYSYQLFNYQEVSPENIPYSQLKQNNVLIINELSDYPSGLIAYLKDFVEQGGNLVIIPNIKEFVSTNKLLQDFGLNPYLSLDTTDTRVWNINLNSSLYKGAVLNYEKNDLLPAVKQHLVRKPDFSKESILLSAKNGDVLLSKAVIDKGQVYIFSFPMQASITDFVNSPLFVVTMVNIGIQSAYAPPMYYVLGKDEVIEISAVESEYFQLKQQNFSIIPELRFLGNRILLNITGLPLKDGVYKLTDQKDSVISYMAFNYSRLESEMDFFTPREIIRIIQNRHLDNIKILSNVLDDFSVVVRKQVEQEGLWKVFVILSIIFLILEVLVNRLIK